MFMSYYFFTENEEKSSAPAPLTTHHEKEEKRSAPAPLTIHHS